MEYCYVCSFCCFYQNLLFRGSIKNCPVLFKINGGCYCSLNNFLKLGAPAKQNNLKKTKRKTTFRLIFFTFLCVL